jgi:hypothetical protein
MNDVETAWFIGTCSECMAVKWFTNAQARDLWERHHPHMGVQ